MKSREDSGGYSAI